MSFGKAFFGFMKGETSQAELDAYRNATGYLDELDAALEARILSQPLEAGQTPWARPRNQHCALAFAWVARALTTIATTLIESDEREDPATAGYLPHVTFQQVKVLYNLVPTYTSAAWEALANPRYRSALTLPVALPNQIEAQGKCPIVHLKGIHAAGLTLDQLGQARLQRFLKSVKQSETPPSEDVKTALGDLTQLWARAQSKVAFTHQQLALVSQGKSVPLATHEDAEFRLWEALTDLFYMGQLIAMPDLLRGAGVHAAGRTVPPDQRWFLSDPQATRDLGGTQFGEQEINYFWKEKKWKTTPREERYMAQCEELVRQGSLRHVSRWATCPFDKIFMTVRPVSVLEHPIGPGIEFHLNMDDNADNLVFGNPVFRRGGYQEEPDHEH